MLNHARLNGLLSDEHFSVDGTLIQAWALMKSFRPENGSGKPPDPGKNGERDFKGKTRLSETHGSTMDDDARLYRKGRGQACQLCFMGHALMENRNAPPVDGVASRSSGAAECAAALSMASDLPSKGKTSGGDKGYDIQDVVMELCELGVTPHVAQNAYDTGKAKRRAAIDGRTTRHPGYCVSQRKRKRIEEIFGWLMTVAGLRQSKFRGLDRVGMSFTFALTAYNLIRMPRLLAKSEP